MSSVFLLRAFLLGILTMFWDEILLEPPLTQHVTSVTKVPSLQFDSMPIYTKPCVSLIPVNIL